MSALTDLFTSMANKIRSKTGGSDTYTPTEMVSAVDDVYAAGYADATTPITPSNTEPPVIYAGIGYKPSTDGLAVETVKHIQPRSDYPVQLSQGDVACIQRNGYAISSYSEVTPSNSSPAQLSGDMVKLNGSGYAIASNPVSLYPSNSNPAQMSTNQMCRVANNGYAIENYGTLTPSDANPLPLIGDRFYKTSSGATVKGYAIENEPTSLTPSDSSPASISNGTIYKAGGAGYAVASQPESKTPSDTSPASVTSGSIVRPSAAGYLYATNHSMGAFGNPSDVTGNAQPLTINTGLPSIRRFFIFYTGNTGGTANCFTTYNADISTTNYITYNSTNAYNKAIGTASGYAYAASVDSISGGTITLKTGANNSAAIKSAWWVACS